MRLLVGDSFRAGRRQRRRRERSPINPRCPRQRWRVQVAFRFLRAGGCAGLQPEGAGKFDQMRRVRFPRRSARAIVGRHRRGIGTGHERATRSGQWPGLVIRRVFVRRSRARPGRNASRRGAGRQGAHQQLGRAGTKHAARRRHVCAACGAARLAAPERPTADTKTRRVRRRARGYRLRARHHAAIQAGGELCLGRRLLARLRVRRCATNMGP